MGTGAAKLSLECPVDPDFFQAVLEGKVLDGSGRQLGRKTREGDIHHRPGCDLTFSAPRSVSLAELIGGDARTVDSRFRIVGRTLGWFERNAANAGSEDRARGPRARSENGDRQLQA